MGYFEGWYFKCCTDYKTIAFIPAYHCSDKKKTASLQIITDDAAINIPFHFIEYSRKPLSARLGSCSFTEQGITLNYHSNNINLEGTLHFQALSRNIILGHSAIFQVDHSCYP